MFYLFIHSLLKRSPALILVSIYIVHFMARYTVHCTVYKGHCPVYTSQCIVHTDHCIVHCTVYKGHCTVYTGHCTVYTGHCTDLEVISFLSCLHSSVFHLFPSLFLPFSSFLFKKFEDQVRRNSRLQPILLLPLLLPLQTHSFSRGFILSIFSFFIFSPPSILLRQILTLT
jgi:hypothetical protein